MEARAPLMDARWIPVMRQTSGTWTCPEGVRGRKPRPGNLIDGTERLPLMGVKERRTQIGRSPLPGMRSLSGPGSPGTSRFSVAFTLAWLLKPVNRRARRAALQPAERSESPSRIASQPGLAPPAFARMPKAAFMIC